MKMTGQKQIVLHKNSDYRLQHLDYLPAFVIWVGTLYSMPQYVFIMALTIALCIRWKQFKLTETDLFFVTAILALSLLNFCWGNIDIPDGRNDRSPYFLAYLGVFLLANVLRKRDLKIIAILIALESLTVFLEAYLGVNTLFSGHPEFRSGLDFSMLYFARPFGLTDGINDFGAKLLTAIIINDYLINRRQLKLILRLILLSALLINFSRSTIFAVFVHYTLYIIFTKNLKNKIYLFLTSFCAVIALAATVNIDNAILKISNQINRGKTDGVDLSYRDIIWNTCIDFIKKHPILGNGSSRFHIWLPDYQAWEHSHNSLLHLISSNGLVIALTMLAWIAGKINKNNILLILPIIIYCIGQYGIFWGISYLDIVFLTILITTQSKTVHAQYTQPTLNAGL